MRELETPSTDPAAAAPTWSLYDYTSPGLRVVRPDSAFPHMRPGDPLHHPWKYLRRDVPHIWYADERFPLMGFMNRDEAVLLHNIALQFAGKNALEIGSWLGWSTVHLALAGVELDVIDPAHDDPVIRASVEDSLAGCNVRANLVAGRSPDSIAPLGKTWSLFFIDGDHEAPSPVRDAMACLPYAAEDCAFVFHDLASPAVAAGLRLLEEKGFNVVIYQTAQIMGLAWRGRVTPVAHTPDPNVAWQLPPHLAGLPISGVDFDPGARRAYRQLRECGAGSPARAGGSEDPPHICIVTSELIGPFKNGGVGTSMTGLAELLASDGLPVTVLYTGTVWSPEIKLDRWKKHYAERGIELEALSIDGMKSLAGPLRDCGFGIPSLVYDFLSRRRFDVIHFNDCCGEGSLALAAKKLGLAFGDSLLVVALHSPSRWVFELNHVLPDNRLAAAFDYGERLSLACADVLWSPSEYLLDWVSAHRFELPQQTFVQQYVMPAAGYPEVTHGRTSVPRELVFFGRLEERKGLRLFCNAVDALRDELAARNITVTFLGKPQTCAGMPSLDYIASRAAHWKFPVRTLTNLGQPEALTYLRDGARLAVMPSPFDNSPCTVYEALSWGIPFLATHTGGIPELVAEADRGHVLFDHSTEGLRVALLEALDHGGWIAQPAIPQDDTRTSWRAFHAGWQESRPAANGQPPTANKSPLVAVIIDHRATANIDRTYASFASSSNINRYIVIDRDKDKDYGLELDAITEEFVLLVHSGVAVTGLQPMLDALKRVHIDGLLPAARHQSHVLPPLGGSAAFALFEGATFTGAMLVRREALMRAKAGRTLSLESPFLGLADFCITRNAKIWPYPEPAVDLEKPIDTKSGLPARIAAYDDVSPDDRYYILAAGYGAATRQQTPQALRRLALTAADLGLTFVVRAGSWTVRRLRRWMR